MRSGRQSGKHCVTAGQCYDSFYLAKGGDVTGALDGIRIFDMSRVLAGPSCTQLLGDLGADIVKVERPGEGDDTRKWGPPFLKDEAGHDTAESSYYLSANRAKRSITLDFTKPEGHAIALRELWALTMREAQTETYSDAFLALMLCLGIATVMVPLMRKVAPPKAPVADAH